MKSESWVDELIGVSSDEVLSSIHAILDIVLFCMNVVEIAINPGVYVSRLVV